MSDQVGLVIERIEKVLPSSASRYGSAIRTWEEWHGGDPFDATPLDVEDFLLHLTNERDFAYSTVNVYHAAMAKFFGQATRLADAGRLDATVPEENPVEDVGIGDVTNSSQGKKAKALEGTEDRHALDAEDVEAVATSVPSPSVRNELIVRLTYSTMMRRTEVVHTKVSDLDRNERSVTVRGEVAKNSEPRKTFYAPSLDRLLDLWISADRESYPKAADSDYLFLSNEAEKLSKFHVGDVVRRAAERAGLQETLYTDAQGNEKKKISVHTLRHSGAVRRWKAGADLRTLQLLLGHEDISTTEGYLDLSDEDLGTKAQKFW